MAGPLLSYKTFTLSHHALRQGHWAWALTAELRRLTCSPNAPQFQPQGLRAMLVGGDLEPVAAPRSGADRGHPARQRVEPDPAQRGGRGGRVDGELLPRQVHRRLRALGLG